jgi:hypothetical protein
MVESFILVTAKKNNFKVESLQVSLMNAKQLVIGRHQQRVILHVAATTPSDLSQALLRFAEIPGVGEVAPLTLWNT